MVYALGTAQLGFDYGINNSAGSLTDDEAERLLDRAADLGYSFVDVDDLHYREATRRVRSYMLAHPGIFKVLVRGANNYVSTYDPEEAMGYTSYNHVRYVQVPANLLDGRMDFPISHLKQAGKTVIVRSLFLQGLLSVDLGVGPVGNRGHAKVFRNAIYILSELSELAAKHGITVPEMAARWAYELDPDIVLVGAEKPEQLSIFTEWMSDGPLPDTMICDIRTLRRGIDREIITPTEWGQDYKFGPGSSG